MIEIVRRFTEAYKRIQQGRDFANAPSDAPARKLPDLTNFICINGIRLFVVDETGDQVIHALNLEVLVAMLEVIDATQVERYRWLDQGLPYQVIQVPFMSGHILVHLNPVPVPR